MKGIISTSSFKGAASHQDPRKSDVDSAATKEETSSRVFGGFLITEEHMVSAWNQPQIPHSGFQTWKHTWSSLQRYDGAVKTILPLLHDGPSEENTQGGLSSGGPSLGQWIFSVWDQTMSFVVPL